MIRDNEKIKKVLKSGGVVVMPTDTIYGIVGEAFNQSTVERIYSIRKRNPDKPCIILIGSIDELTKFSIDISEEQKNKLKEFWGDSSRPTSAVLDCSDEKFRYLHRGTNTLAFRLPYIKKLRELLLETGPLIAPSANTEKFPASENIEDAKKYFGDDVDLYMDGGPITSKASKVIRLHKNGSVSILRE